MEGTNLEPDWKKPLALPDLPAEDVLSAFLTYMVSISSDLVLEPMCMPDPNHHSVLKKSVGRRKGCRVPRAYF